jgi:hypothetical protein
LPYGPIKIAANRQIVLPKALIGRLHLQPGDMVYVLQSDSEPHSRVIIPVKRVSGSDWAVQQSRQAADQAERMQDDGESLSD